MRRYRKKYKTIIEKKRGKNEKIKLIWNKSMYLYVNIYDLWKKSLINWAIKQQKNIQPT